MIFGFLQNIGPWQLIICVLVAFVFLGGAKKISEVARELGKAKGAFKQGLDEGEAALKKEAAKSPELVEAE